MACARPLAVATAALAALAGCGGAEPMVRHGVSGPAEILYATAVSGSGGGGLFVVREDGSGRRAIGPRAASGDFDGNLFDPAWSPDGTQIAFVAGTDANRSTRDTALFVMDVDGGNVRRLTGGGEQVIGPAWSPDGTRIAFAAVKLPFDEPRAMTLELVDTDGGRRRGLTAPPIGTFDGSPAWTPDGRDVLFHRGRTDAQFELSVSILAVAAAGGQPRTVAAHGFEPALSPDGRRLAFTSYRDRNGQTCYHDCQLNGEIYVAGADGSGATRLTRTSARESSPAWSPDGRRLAFASNRGRQGFDDELWVMNADGSCPRRVLREPGARNGLPAWRPGGTTADPCGRPDRPPLVRPALVGGPASYSLSELRRFARGPLWWPGPTIGGLAPSSAPRGVPGAMTVTLMYDACVASRESACPREPLQVQLYATCGRPIPSYARTLRIRGADARLRGDGVEIRPGRSTVIIFGPRALALRAARALRPLNAAARRVAPSDGRLPASRYGRPCPPPDHP